METNEQVEIAILRAIDSSLAQGMHRLLNAIDEHARVAVIEALCYTHLSHQQRETLMVRLADHLATGPLKPQI